ncbi:ferrous iron transport protein B [Clostridiaceae bacterium OttesenSCG-928-D20]|nr:ferrous iron transport protein B [Clostridiaceae bacterium OttesenSCG-928-D20]
MSITIALAGNPNSGKTTMFNALTGANQFVGNWPGVTVERKSGKVKSDPESLLVDLPGIYSLSPYTLEEIISRDYLLSGEADVVLNLVDASNIERNLYLTTQLMEMGLPVVMALNMIDVVRKSGATINMARLSELIGARAVETSALKSEGVLRAVELCKESVGVGYEMPEFFKGDIQKALVEIEGLIKGSVPEKTLRWHAIKLFERDKKTLEKLSLNAAQETRIEELRRNAEQKYDDDCESIIISARYEYITEAVKECVVKSAVRETPSDKLDSILTNRYLALPIFAVIMFLVYYISITTVGAFLTEAMEYLFADLIGPGTESLLVGFGVSDWLVGLVVEGIIGGVGGVLSFVPQMFVLFFFLSIMEDVGYMARIAFIMDKIFRRFGLSGKSFIPMLIGTGCSVPGIMASRTIEQERDRKMTIITTSFMPCGAKLPIIALIAAELFDGAWWVAPSAYFIGMGAIAVSGIILKKTRAFSGEPSPFVMELPPYHIPSAKNVFRGTWERGFSFVKRAGSVILIASVFIWFTSSFSLQGGSLVSTDDIDRSLLGIIGTQLAFVFRPLGFGSWQATVATVLGLVAKEEIVGALTAMSAVAGQTTATFFGSQMAAYSFLVFNLLCAPCFAAIGAIIKEMRSWKWSVFAVLYQTLFAYAISLIVYQLSLLFTGAAITAPAISAIVLLFILVYMLLRKGSDESLQVKKGVYNG